MLKYKPSQIAASAVYLARVIFDEKPWTPTLHHYSKYNPWELKSCVMELYRIHAAECKILVTNRENAKAVSEKYYSDRFEYASASPSPPLQKLETSFHCFLR
jgi:cyclin A